jgi:hypothetical protein
MTTPDLDLRGKDYLTEREAAHYAGVSVSQLRAHRAAYGIMPGRFMGKLLYRRVDLQRAIENAWQPSARAGATGASTGRTRRANGTGSASAA